MKEPTWIVCPFIDCSEYTIPATNDFLDQEEGSRVLLINNGSEDADRNRVVQAFSGSASSRVFFWHHDPPLPSLDATWNRALDFVWETGGEEALVVNNDVRIHRRTLMCLKRILHAQEALFVTAVNDRDHFDQDSEAECYEPSYWSAKVKGDPGGEISKGGPDFSCFLISRECHEKYRFDDSFTYCGDLDLHRRIMLGGDGDRIFGVGIPYYHFASRTINRSRKAAEEGAAIADLHRAAYARKWGASVNEERWNFPFNEKPTAEGVCTRTPDLQHHRCGGVPHAS